MKNNARIFALPSPTENQIEYSVYIHHGNDNIEKPRRWERASKTKDKDLALEQAQMLHLSDRYEKVEVKKIFFCHNKKKRIGETLKTYDKQNSKNKNITLQGLALAGMLSLFFGIAFLLGNE